MSKVRAIFDGFVGLEGVPILLHEGEERDLDDPLVVARPDLFTAPAPAPEPKRPVVRGRAKGGDE